MAKGPGAWAGIGVATEIQVNKKRNCDLIRSHLLLLTPSWLLQPHDKKIRNAGEALESLGLVQIFFHDAWLSKLAEYKPNLQRRTDVILTRPVATNDWIRSVNVIGVS